MKFSNKIQAVQLREQGKSYSEIKNIVQVSKSTLSSWLKDIELTKEQTGRLSKLQATAYLSAKKKQSASLKHHNEIQIAAQKESTKLAKDSFFVAGLMLYWAEGNKSFGSVQFSNSDPIMIQIMMRWFRKFCFVPENKFRIGLIIHSLHIREDCQKFWQGITSVPLTQFHSPFVKPSIFSSKKNKLYEGTCKIVIHNRDLLSRIIGWRKGVTDNFLYNK
jgi:hypothetical protein